MPAVKKVGAGFRGICQGLDSNRGDKEHGRNESRGEMVNEQGGGRERKKPKTIS